MPDRGHDARKFPGTTPELIRFGDSATITNAWEGPQLTVPGRVELAEYQPAIVVTTDDPRKIELIRASGVPARNLFLMSELAPVLEQRLPQLGSYAKDADRYAFVNFVLREISLIARFNRENETCDQLMRLPELASR